MSVFTLKGLLRVIIIKPKLLGYVKSTLYKFIYFNPYCKVARIGESILYILVDFWWILAPIVIGYFKPSLTLFSLNNNWISIKELKFNSDPKTKVP